MTFDCCRHCGDMACPGGMNNHLVRCPECQPSSGPKADTRCGACLADREWECRKVPRCNPSNKEAGPGKVL